ncbi:MAG TPA: FtsX-like permease family protein [Candidatus Saccharimonadales bacterium]|nr:FtsX-like permease family protein [Candidatus Saccharimonadales bacterium]
MTEIITADLSLAKRDSPGKLSTHILSIYSGGAVRVGDMNVISRGIRNAFRNSVRTISIVIILGLSIGLSLIMLIAHQAVTKEISTVKSSIGNTVTIQPAGFSSFSQVNNALTTAELSKVQALPHVTSVDESLTDRLTKIGSSTPSFGGQSSSTSNNTTSLTSPITFNLNSNGNGGQRFFINGGGSGLPTNFSPPITIVGTTDPSTINGTALTITSGTTITGTKDANDVLVSRSMASKNSLKVGSTFTAYNTTLTVVGIFKSDSESVSSNIIVSLPGEQRLSNQSGDVTSAVATVDSLDNLSSTTTAIKNTLGSAADVTSSVTQANAKVAPLNSVKSISLFSLIGAVVAGAIIILLVMIMIVRERRREIGVLKAIGGSNLRIMTQFVSEAITLTVLGAVIGVIIGVVGGTPVTTALVKNSTSSQVSGITAPGGGRFGGGGQSGGASTPSARPSFSTRFRSNSVVSSASNIHAEVGWSILLYGFGAAVLIAIVGSALASVLIAKVRPAEVMRAE